MIIVDGIMLLTMSINILIIGGGNATYYVYKYSDNSSNIALIIKISTNVIVNIGSGNVGSNINITAILTDKNNNLLINQELIFKKEGVEIGRGITDKNGRVVITYLLNKEETVGVNVFFNGFNNTYEPSEGYDTKTFKNKTNSNPNNNGTDLKSNPTPMPNSKPDLNLLQN